MAESIQVGWRAALSEIVTRRTALGASVLGTSGLLALTHDVDAKKKKKRKKRKKRNKGCANGAVVCGAGCCAAPSICSAASCFCIGNEGNCKPIAQELINIIAAGLGVPPEQIAVNPEQPLVQCPASLEERARVDQLVDKGFGVAGPVNWCLGGINAGVADIVRELTSKG